MQKEELHIPVLLSETLQTLRPEEGEKYLDLTAGFGGHAAKFLEATKNYKDAVLVDRDQFAIDHLDSLQSKGAKLIHDNFYNASLQLIKCGKKFDIVLMDLGVSSPQLDMAARGFSFQSEGPLDMRMNREDIKTASKIVNTWREQDLVDLFVEYGEVDRKEASNIARTIKFNRPITTTTELAEIIKNKSRHKFGRTHPATRYFQALRLAVNDELELLEKTLTFLPELLQPGGRAGIISFHSLEDRIVKNYFKAASSKGLESEFKIITKKPIDGQNLDNKNPRARSAKLRAALKT